MSSKAFKKARARAGAYLASLRDPSRAKPGKNRLVGVDGMGGVHTLTRQGDGMWGGTLTAVDESTGETVTMPFAVPDITARRWTKAYEGQSRGQVAS